jgi:hypothetical protein
MATVQPRTAIHTARVSLDGIFIICSWPEP